MKLFLSTLLFASAMAVAVPTVTTTIDADAAVTLGQDSSVAIPIVHDSPVVKSLSSYTNPLSARYAECGFDGTVRETCTNGKVKTTFVIAFNDQKYYMDIEPGKQYFQGLNFLWYPPVPADTRGNMYFAAPGCQFWENNNKPTPPPRCATCTRTWWTGSPLNCANPKDNNRGRQHNMHCDYMCG